MTPIGALELTAAGASSINVCITVALVAVVDASADPGDLQEVLTNATRRCPRDLLGLCGSLAAAAQAALKETNG